LKNKNFLKSLKQNVYNIFYYLENYEIEILGF